MKYSQRFIKLLNVTFYRSSAVELEFESRSAAARVRLEEVLASEFLGLYRSEES